MHYVRRYCLEFMLSNTLIKEYVDKEILLAVYNAIIQPYLATVVKFGMYSAKLNQCVYKNFTIELPVL